MSAAIEMQAISRTYPGPPEVRALANVDLCIDAGEMLAIVGPSGSGKSTMLNIIGTLDRPTSGRLRVEGVDTSDLDDGQLAGLRAARIGFVFQAYHLLPTLNALDNVATGPLYGGEPLAVRRKMAREALGRVGLGDRAEARPNELSGGERQRVAVARAVAAEPAVILADEPTGNLDTATGTALVELFQRLHSEGSTIAIITHDTEVAELMPRIVSLRDGSVEADNKSVGATQEAGPSQ